ncbi:DnaJ family domain-containing protein [Virgibacillus ainsalahensis]
MYIFVEEKIKESIKNGDFNNLPGKGERLDLKEDFPGLSKELNMSYRILKNAGYISEETDRNKENITFDDLLTSVTGEKNEAKLKKKTQEYEVFIKKRKLHKNSKFATYAKKIYSKLLNK